MTEGQSIVTLVLKAVALAMGVASVVLTFLNVATIDTSITLLGIGLFAVSLASLQEPRQ